MDKYYYLISSLPLLKFTEKPYITIRDFITEAEKWLLVEDFTILFKVDINNFIRYEKDVPALKKYKNKCLKTKEETY